MWSYMIIFPPPSFHKHFRVPCCIVYFVVRLLIDGEQVVFFEIYPIVHIVLTMYIFFMKKKLTT
jgi:hypothetical protein